MKIIKFISTFLIITIIISLVSAPVYADTQQQMLDSLFGAGDFIGDGEKASKGEIDQVDSDTKVLIETFGSIMIAGGIIVILIISLVVGIQYMMASVSGDAEKKASHKKALIILVLAMFLLTSANFIFKFVVKSMNDLKLEEISL